MIELFNLECSLDLGFEEIGLLYAYAVFCCRFNLSAATKRVDRLLIMTVSDVIRNATGKVILGSKERSITYVSQAPSIQPVL